MADKIEVRPNGPLRVYGPFNLVDGDGKSFKLPAGEFVTLCRCGASKNKPFCDSSHRTTIKFEANTKAS
ncbi:MAG: CDGSH iron-sulfur domain-containing protein [SAR202 cluster bacterium]|nr:CDGSH iron-sulfur domain-containing protein [SAR202 cluster bacterium]